MSRRFVVALALAAGLAVLAYAGAQLWLARLLDARAAELMERLPPAVTVEAGGWQVRLHRHEARLTDVVVAGGPAGRLRIAEIRLDRFDFRHEVPHYARGTLQGVTVETAEAGPALRSALGALGYDRMALDADFSYSYDAERRTLTLEALRLSAPGMATLDVEAEIAGLATLAPETPLAVLAIGLRAALARLTLRYRDDGLAERVAAAEARRTGASAADVRGRLVRDIDAAIADAADDGPRAAFAGLRRFVAAPGAVTLVAAPREPVPLFRLAGMRSPAMAFRLLGVTVSSGP